MNIHPTDTYLAMEKLVEKVRSVKLLFYMLIYKLYVFSAAKSSTKYISHFILTFIMWNQRRYSMFRETGFLGFISIRNKDYSNATIHETV